MDVRVMCIQVRNEAARRAWAQPWKWNGTVKTSARIDVLVIGIAKEENLGWFAPVHNLIIPNATHCDAFFYTNDRNICL